MKHEIIKMYCNKTVIQILIAIVLTISIFAVYYQVKGFEFIYYDDPKYG